MPRFSAMKNENLSPTFRLQSRCFVQFTPYLPASQQCTTGECTTAASQLLRSSPGKSGQGQQCTTGILPDMGTACGQHISHFSWDTHNSGCTLHCSCVSCGFGRFQTSADAALVFKDEHAPTVRMPCLPSSSSPWQTCVAGASS